MAQYVESGSSDGERNRREAERLLWSIAGQDPGLIDEALTLMTKIENDSTFLQVSQV